MFSSSNATKDYRSIAGRMIAGILLSIGMLLHAPLQLFSADLALSPAQNTYAIGKTFTVDVHVTNNTESINGVSGSISFPVDVLSVRSVSKDGSIIKLWAEEPSYSNTKGTVNFEGVILNPGFSESRGKVLSITFSTRNIGEAKVALATGQVLANDGQASNVLGKLGSATFTITEAEKPVPVETETKPVAALATTKGSTILVTSLSYPDQDTWYRNRQASFMWKVPESVTSIRTLYSDEPYSIPNKVYTPPISRKEFTLEEEGVMYMHVQGKDVDGWGPVSHYKFQVDITAPTDIKASLVDGTETAHANPDVKVTARDTLSGLSTVEFTVDGIPNASHTANDTGIYALTGVKPGTHTATVNVKDKAGNTTSATFSFTVVEINAPVITEYKKQATVGDVLKVAGTTYPNVPVEITYTNTKDDRTYTKTVQSDKEGSFVFLWTEKLPAGVYEMQARVTNLGGATSAYTSPRTLNLEQQQFIRIGMFVMNWLSLALILILASFCIVALSWYLFLHFMRFKRGVHRTIRETESTLKTNVAGLRRDSEEFYSLLIKTEKKRDLTKEEQSIMRKFKKRLDIVEKEIERKLKQIG